MNRTMAVVCGERRISPNEAEGLVHFYRVIRQGALRGQPQASRIIAENAPGSLDELARVTGKAKSNLSRTQWTMKWTCCFCSRGKRVEA
jgi:hypothetical protein